MADWCKLGVWRFLLPNNINGKISVQRRHATIKRPLLLVQQKSWLRAAAGGNVQPTKRPLPCCLVQAVMVEEPSPEAALHCLQGLRPRYEAHHGVRLADSALEAAVTAAQRYIPDRWGGGGGALGGALASLGRQLLQGPALAALLARSAGRYGAKRGGFVLLSGSC